MKSKAITLLSGGLDSTVATLLAMKDYDVKLALTFDYGQRAARREIDSAKTLCRRFSISHNTVELPWLAKITKTALVNRHEDIPEVSAASLDANAKSRAADVWVPNRNGIFVAIAAAIAESKSFDAIIAGFNAEEAATFPDNSEIFLNSVNVSLQYSTLNKVKLFSPTIKMTKTQIANYLKEVDIKPNQLWFCYEGNEKPCGRCESCARAARAFAKAGI